MGLKLLLVKIFFNDAISSNITFPSGIFWVSKLEGIMFLPKLCKNGE
jgi:hypothetical protein